MATCTAAPDPSLCPIQDLDGDTFAHIARQLIWTTELQLQHLPALAALTRTCMHLAALADAPPMHAVWEAVYMNVEQQQLSQCPQLREMRELRGEHAQVQLQQAAMPGSAAAVHAGGSEARAAKSARTHDPRPRPCGQGRLHALREREKSKQLQTALTGSDTNQMLFPALHNGIGS